MSHGFAAIPDAPRYRLTNARAPLSLVTTGGLAADAEGLCRDRHHDRGRAHRLDRARGHVQPRRGPARARSRRRHRPARASSTSTPISTRAISGRAARTRTAPSWARSTMPARDREANWTADDVRARMDFALRCAFAHGTGAIRTHLDSHRAADRDLLAGLRRAARGMARPHRAAGGCAVPDRPRARRRAGSSATVVATVARYGGVLGGVTFIGAARRTSAPTRALDRDRRRRPTRRASTSTFTSTRAARRRPAPSSGSPTPCSATASPARSSAAIAARSRS